MVLVTTLLIIVGIAASTTALSAYLRVFDWHLIWIIDYPDVIKWGLVTLAVISAFALSGWSIIDDAIVWVSSNNYKPAIWLAAFWSISLAVWLLIDYRSQEPHYSLTFFLHLTVFMLTITAVNIAQTVRLYPTNITRHVIADAFFIIFSAGIIGTMIGYMLRDGWGFQHHVDTKSTVDYRSVGLVMITSRYVVIWDRDHAVILPAEDVTKIEGQPKS